MFRKLVFVLCALSFTLASCGRQVTPNRTGTSGGLPSGFMQIKFSTAQPMDFVNVWYVIALNTEGAANGTNGMPYPQYGNQSYNWLNYSFEIIVYQLTGQTSPSVALYQLVTEHPAGQPPYKLPVPVGYTQGDILLNSNCNQQSTQFCLQINRRVFAGLSSASPTPSPSPSVSPSASPSATPSGSPSPAPSSTPSVTGSWFINWFTVTPNPSSGATAPYGAVIDAPGPQGVNDQTWMATGEPYNTATAFDVPWNAVPPPGWPQVSNGAAQIAGGEVLNTP